MGRRRSWVSMTSARSNSGVAGGQTTSGSTTANPMGQFDSGDLCPKWPMMESRRANMDSLACMNGLFLSAATFPCRSIVRQYPVLTGDSSSLDFEAQDALTGNDYDEIDFSKWAGFFYAPIQVSEEPSTHSYPGPYPTGGRFASRLNSQRCRRSEQESSSPWSIARH